MRDAGNGLDEQLLRELTVSAVAGKRHESSKRFLQDAASRVSLQVLAIAIEVTRYLSGWFMRRARE
eukprot:15519524-Heterocapsa_arctica.AAC.1